MTRREKGLNAFPGTEGREARRDQSRPSVPRTYEDGGDHGVVMIGHRSGSNT